MNLFCGADLFVAMQKTGHSMALIENIQSVKCGELDRLKIFFSQFGRRFRQLFALCTQLSVSLRELARLLEHPRKKNTERKHRD